MQSSTDAPQVSFLSRVRSALDRYVTPQLHRYVTPRTVRPLAAVTAVTMFVVYALGTLVTVPLPPGAIRPSLFCLAIPRCR